MSDPMIWEELIRAERPYLRKIACRMLGNAGEADDALQEVWLRLSNADQGSIDNRRAWLTTVLSRICLDMLRARSARPEEPATADVEQVSDERAEALEHDAMLADSVGVALLITLDRLAPRERLAFVLHDIFEIPFDQIAAIIDCSPLAARQVASRARRRVRGGPIHDDSSSETRRELISAFLKAAHAGDFRALVTLLDPAVVLDVDRNLSPLRTPMRIAGADGVAHRAMLGKGRRAALARIDGEIGIVVAVRQRLRLALAFAVIDGRISHIDLIADPKRLKALRIATVDPIAGAAGDVSTCRGGYS